MVKRKNTNNRRVVTRREPFVRRPAGGAFTPPIDPPMRNQAPWSHRVLPFTANDTASATIYTSNSLGTAIRGYLGVPAATANLEIRVRKISVWATATTSSTVAPFVRMDVADLRRPPNAGADPTQINALHTSTDQGTLNRPARVGYTYRPFEMITIDELNSYPVFITSGNTAVQVYVDVVYRFLPPPPTGAVYQAPAPQQE